MDFNSIAFQSGPPSAFSAFQHKQHPAHQAGPIGCGVEKLQLLVLAVIVKEVMLVAAPPAAAHGVRAGLPRPGRACNPKKAYTLEPSVSTRLQCSPANLHLCLPACFGVGARRPLAVPSGVGACELAGNEGGKGTLGWPPLQQAGS